MIDLDDKPLPQADSASARLAAQRASALADELSRLQQQLRGATSRDGWTGAARLAFDESMQARIAMFDPVIRRYQSYASSLNSYAQAVDQVELPLRNLRSRLDNQPRGPDGSPGDAELLNQYQRLWSSWDDARRRCLSDLERASHFGADRHGLSRLWHSVTHEAHEFVSHVNLREISHALDDLGDALFVTALIFTPVPGLGEALWAAVAIVSAAKLGVDGARYAEGDKSVSPTDLAWDAAGVLPGGKAAKSEKFVQREAPEVLRLRAKVPGLNPDASAVRIVPGGGLAGHEAPWSPNGHTLRKHVAKTYTYLISRFQKPTVFRSSSYSSRALAEHLVSHALAAADPGIQAWLRSSSSSLRILAESKEVVGISISRKDLEVRQTTKYIINLEKDPSRSLGYYIPTSHPDKP